MAMLREPRHSVMDPLSTAASSLIQASNAYSQASVNVVKAALPGATTDQPTAVVSRIAAQTQFQASTKLVEASNEMFKSTLNILV